MILSDLATLAICSAQLIIYLKSAPNPAPGPSVRVGVFTAIKIISAFNIASSISVEKNKFLSLFFFYYFLETWLINW